MWRITFAFSLAFPFAFPFMAGCSAPAALQTPGGDASCAVGETGGACSPGGLDAAVPAVPDVSKCVPSCVAPTPVCGKDGLCVACAADTDCPAGNVCQDAAAASGVVMCVPGCADDARCAGLGPTMKCCGMRCADSATDAANCGACGTSCGAAHSSASCAAGLCVAGTCDEGWGDCNKDPRDGCEANLHIDPANCGMCGAACAFPNGVAACADTCYLAACAFGYDDCNGDPSDGCETPVLSDPMNCGACGTVCAGAPHAQATCVNAACAITSCDQGWADCDAMGNNGCEVSVGTDVKNCGACNNVCAQGLACINGACTCPQCNFPNAKSACVNNVCTLTSCVVGYADCDKNPANGCEVDTATDAANCGGCGAACPNNLPFCAASVCVSAPACGGWVAMGGCWYTTDVSQSCNDLCNQHGGFDAQSTLHMGNPVCTHFYPQKANGNNWVTVECCSTDNNTNWGANGAAPDPTFSHPACHLACSCLK